MTDKIEISGSEIERIARYKEIVREMYLEALESNGYHQGFDFDTVSIEISPIPGYAVPRFSGSVQFRKDIIYIPEGVKYEVFFEVSFIEKDEGVEIVKREREHYETSGLDEIQESLENRENKGPYPGSKYFLAELDRIDQSLKQHKPQLLLGDDLFVELEKPLGTGLEALVASDASFYAMSTNTVLIYLPDEAVTFIYNIETGEISKVSRIPPPSLV